MVGFGADFVKSSIFCNVWFRAVLAKFLMLHTVVLVQRQRACLALPGDVGAAGCEVQKGHLLVAGSLVFGFLSVSLPWAM